MEQTYIDMACVSALVKLREKPNKHKKLNKNKGTLHSNTEEEKFIKNNKENIANILKRKQNSSLLVSPVTNRNLCRRSAVMETDVADRILVKETLKEYMKIKSLRNYGF